ncbi:hypothetical protein F5J12DRAFT_913758 [Pisolithus orientalis]|uniref:uncharacterized protein n=1 Tax=Pisolithus orientalis TaxID=936130 RepID=UPI0022257B37|nr:uncharacterized protein F5J12DRAFT_913758 [Pisolithus orientalis]KAI6003214.1 hypothetical protein F5J12DRAFT_913758 [Pisolithus orientalis]
MELMDDVSRRRANLEHCLLGHEDPHVALSDLAEAHYDSFKKEGRIKDLNEAITLHRATLEFQPIEDHKRSSTLNDLAACLSKRYDNQGVVADLDEAVMFGRAALELRPPGHPHRGVSLYNLACFFRRRFRKQADMRDLGESIELLRETLALCPPRHPHRHSFLHNLALCLADRYHNNGVLADLVEAVMLGRAALELCPLGHPGHGVSLHYLAGHLRAMFVQQAAICNLEEAIELSRAALELRPPGHPDRFSSLSLLALCLSDRYGISEGTDDLEEAVALRRAALALRPPGHPDRDVSLNNLACDLRKKFQKQSAMHDLDEAIELHRAVLELRPAGHPHRPSSLNSLILCFSNRYDHQGLAADLEEAVTLGRAALELCPPGHPDRGESLHTVARDLWKRFQKQADAPELHKANQATSVVHPTSHPDVPSSLFELSLHLWDKFQKQATLADLDEAICLATYVLELQLPGHPDYADSLQQLALFVREGIQRLAQQMNLGEAALLSRAVDNLGTLANYFRERSHNQHTIAYLGEAIALYEYVLKFRPIGHPNRASSLHDLAQCLAERFRRQPTATDLNKAIALEQEALQLFIPGDPGYDISRRCFVTCLQMKIRSEVAVASPSVSPVTHVDIKEAIRNVAFEIFKTIPTRLLHTHNGILCNRDAQISHFMSSQQYNELLSSCTRCDPGQRKELIHTALSRYFQFVMFSHRWAEGEPLLRDIEGQPIYAMSAKGGFGKLQAFCVAACEWGYLWAWSDTCCIDKDSSAEFQEAVGSMFAWYRRSALTIVYLSDVPDTGSFESSEWFTRGWTLQELLAPKRIVFYTQTWSPYKNLKSSNHKTDDAVLQELERATGIESRFLTNFSPGMDDARWRLQWASQRRTTRPEDVAYSLLGIFDFHLPLLYGETAANALGRLLAEIISRSGDISVLDWVGEPSPYHSCFPANINWYQKLVPSSPSQCNAGEQSSPMSPQSTPRNALQKLRALLATPLFSRFLGGPRTPSASTDLGPAVRLRTPDSYARSDMYGFHSLTKAPLPRFINGRLILPCVVHHITAVQRRRANPHGPSYMYGIQASGLRPLEVALPSELEDTTMTQGALQLVRPWHSKLLGPSTELYATIEERLLYTLGRPFNALLLIELPHNEYKRIASSTPIIAQPMSRASILKSKVRVFNIV